MATQLSIAVRNSRLNAISTVAGPSALLEIYSGTMPASCATAATGLLLCTMTLPTTYLSAAVSGVTSKSGVWTGTGSTSATSTGTNAGYFRLMDSSNTNCHLQGTITATAGGGDMTLDNINIATNQVATTNTFSLTDGNA